MLCAALMVEARHFRVLHPNFAHIAKVHGVGPPCLRGIEKQKIDRTAAAAGWQPCRRPG